MFSASSSASNMIHLFPLKLVIAETSKRVEGRVPLWHAPPTVSESLNADYEKSTKPPVLSALYHARGLNRDGHTIFFSEEDQPPSIPIKHVPVDNTFLLSPRYEAGEWFYVGQQTNITQPVSSESHKVRLTGWGSSNILPPKS